MSNVNRCITYVEGMAKEKQETAKKSENLSMNHQWAVILAAKLDKLDEMEAEDVKYEIDGIVLKATKASMQK